MSILWHFVSRCKKITIRPRLVKRRVFVSIISCKRNKNISADFIRGKVQGVGGGGGGAIKMVGSSIFSLSDMFICSYGQNPLFGSTIKIALNYSVKALKLLHQWPLGVFIWHCLLIFFRPSKVTEYVTSRVSGGEFRIK